ncbi:MAG: Lipopolysaccharide/colanic/teichoic acid biosynthesis glycosyltransferase [uncultured Campylobacterales bacterium]|uniref:Lipopolysaccharide/colanic/teichoic acid biosynthesis glycosyltransferase n=1 Tax=uncultured Campylobacterales bacterium TaxID=352960 RepID=A0A6S6SI80_9BACT|nr:MAG: Lipopolysaccharide/colanic/teichoic acid biosynthesis glycosyltransferase [uncultured Campylobacterales bacterium]
MLIIIGNEYQLLKNEISLLENKFGNIKYSLEYDPSTKETILLNKSNQISTKKNIHTLEEFLPKYLKKCYIPKNIDNSEIHYDIKSYSFFQKFQKKCIDFFGIFWLFFFSWPVMIKCKNQIKKESPGPVLYKQKRVGKNNKEFTCMKFRSMKLDAEKHGVQFAQEDDDRIFPWGEVMRKTRFDELPQMYNILKGEMHLIGPRPERKYWTDKFEKTIPSYSKRHKVSPGITGWAQVNYPYGENEEDARQKLMYDLYYIKHWNILLELSIVYKTMLTVVRKKGV